MSTWYVTREEVMSSSDIKVSAFQSAAIDRAIASSSRTVDRFTHRGDHTRPGFGQWTGTLTFDYPNTQTAGIGRLWLDANTLLSLTTFVAGGVTIPTANVLLRPQSGPPYTYIEIDRSTSSALAMRSGTAQDAISITGVWGFSSQELPAGTLSANVSSTSATTIGVTPSGTAFGVGDTLRVDSERLIVTGKSWVASGQTGSLTSAMNAQTLAVSDGTVFMPGEELLLDAERVLVRDVAGNNLIVQRAWSGSILAAHTTTSILWPRTLSVTRGALGTTAATHTSGASISRQYVPGPVRQLALAYALDDFIQPTAGYARTIGSGENEMAANGRGIKDLEARVMAYARMARHRAV